MELIQGKSNFGEMAHIVPNEEGGKVTADNLILVCRNCHKEIDDNRTRNTADSLRKLKSDRDNAIKQEFSLRYTSFEDLRLQLEPIFKRNGAIFASYGPESNGQNHTSRRELWLRNEFKLVANNRKLAIILDRNRGLLHPQNHDIVDDFISHVNEFETTREVRTAQRINLFPTDLLSIFGFKQSLYIDPHPMVNPIQNLMSLLVSEGRFIDLQLIPEQILFYRENDNEIALDLTDLPRVRQILWTEKVYQPKRTELRFEDLIFFLNWLRTNDIPYKFGNITDLTCITLNNRFQVMLFYEYCLSVESLYGIEPADSLLAVNLHGWNGGPYSDQAFEYAKTLNMKLFNQNGFFAYAHRNIK